MNACNNDDRGWRVNMRLPVDIIESNLSWLEGLNRVTMGRGHVKRFTYDSTLS